MLPRRHQSLHRSRVHHPRQAHRLPLPEAQAGDDHERLALRGRLRKQAQGGRATCVAIQRDSWLVVSDTGQDLRQCISRDGAVP